MQVHKPIKLMSLDELLENRFKPVCRVFSLGCNNAVQSSFHNSRKFDYVVILYDHQWHSVRVLTTPSEQSSSSSLFLLSVMAAMRERAGHLSFVCEIKRCVINSLGLFIYPQFIPVVSYCYYCDYSRWTLKKKITKRLRFDLNDRLAMALDPSWT